MSAASLHDAKAGAWREENAPDPTPERLRYDAMTERKMAIGHRLREWPEKRSGSSYEALVLEWIEAARLADEAYDAMIAASQTGDAR